MRQRVRRGAGQAMVELAIITVPLLILVFGTVGVGRLVRVHMAVDAVAREAARAATLAPLPDDSGAYGQQQALDGAVDAGQTRAVEVAKDYGLVIQPSDIVVVADPNFDRGAWITVTVNFTQNERDLPFFPLSQLDFKAVHSEQVDKHRSRSL